MTGALATPRDRRIALLWVLAGLVVYGAGIGARDLWDPDEPRYAEVAREMREDGHWVVPHVNGRVYGHKPPLFFWAVAACSFVTGQVNAWSARAPSVLAASLLLGLTYAFGVRWFGRREGLFAAAILATSYLYAMLAMHANIDATHALFTTAALYLWFGSVECDAPRPAGICAAWALAGLALLTKGVGVLLVLLATGVYLGWSGRWRSRRLVAWNLAGVLVALGVAALWYVPAWRSAGADYAREIGVHQTITRATDPWSHERGPFYFFLNFPLDALPWSLFLPAVAIWLRGALTGTGAPQARFLAGWFASIFVFFTAIASKRQIYLLPLFPAFALACGAALAARPGWDRLTRIPGWILAGLLGCAGAAGLVLALVPGEQAAARAGHPAAAATFSALRPAAAVGALALLAHAAALARVLRRGTPAGLVAVVLSLAACTALLATLWVLPVLNPLRSARAFSAELSRHAPPGTRVASFRFLQEEIVFYSRRTLVEIDVPRNAGGPGSELREELALLDAFIGSEGQSLVLVRAKDLSLLKDLSGALVEIHRGSVGGDTIVLLAER